MATDDYQADLTRWMARQGALLITLALFTGFLVAGAMTGKLPADGHTMLASHLNALLGGFWVLGVAFSLPWVRFSERGTRLLARAVVIAQYANWATTALKAFLKVSGLEPTQDARNNAIFGILTLLVVLPSIGAGIAWFIGLGPAGTRNASGDR